LRDGDHEIGNRSRRSAAEVVILLFESGGEPCLVLSWRNCWGLSQIKSATIAAHS
jgi:hypothetical protein